MDTDLELRHLRYFVAVAEELHFGRAAARLHLAQPPLSQQIRRLEEILGYALLARTSRSVRLTAAGEVFLTRARRLLRTVHEDVEEARSIGRGEMGLLRIGFIGSGMLTPLPRALGMYRKAYPGVSLQLHEAFTAAAIHGLLSGALDACFLRDAGETDGLDTQAIYREPFVAVLPKDHPAARARHFSMALLRHEPFVFYPRSAGELAYEKPVSLCEEHGYRPRVVQEAPHWLSIVSLVGAGLGVSLAPACVERVCSAEVVCRRLGRSAVMSHIEFAWKSGEDRAIVGAFAEIAQRSFRKH